MGVLEVTTIVPSQVRGAGPALTMEVAQEAVLAQDLAPVPNQVQGQIRAATRVVAQITAKKVVKRRAKRKEKRRRRKKENMCRQKCPSSSSCNRPLKRSFSTLMALRRTLPSWSGNLTRKLPRQDSHQ